MSDVSALRTEVNRRFGKVETDLKKLSGQLEDIRVALERVAKDAHNELAQARREERDANAETVDAGVSQAVDAASSVAGESVAELREEIVAAFDTLGNAAKDVF